MGKNKTKLKNIPLALRIIPWLFPKLETVAPWLAQRLFVHLFFTPMRYKPTDKELEVAATADKIVEVVNGKQIQVYSWGEGIPVLLLHGWAGRGTQLRKFIEPLNTSGYQAIAIDGPAHGLSDGKKTDLEDFKATLFHIVEHYKIKAIIAHSFGGAASLFSIANGLPVKTLINIATPTIGDEIIKTYLRTLNASPKIGEYFKKFVKKKSGYDFDHFTAMEFMKHVPADLNLLLIHDVEDRDVIIEQPRSLVKAFPTVRLIETTGLGHTRILKDEAVIRHAVTFIHFHASG